MTPGMRQAPKKPIAFSWLVEVSCGSRCVRSVIRRWTSYNKYLDCISTRKRLTSANEERICTISVEEQYNT